MLLEILFPPRCPICGDIVMPKGEKACPECRMLVKYAVGPCCLKCGKPLSAANAEEEYCRDCFSKKHFFDAGKAVFVYDEIMKKSIAQFKYNHRCEYAKFYAEEMIRFLSKDIERWKADAMIPIPLHKSRKKWRGFNQSELIAKELEKELSIPVCTDLIIRHKKTKAQKQLNSQERQNNLKKAFKIVQNDVKLSTVILIDDIYTTGSTIDAVSSLLKQAGVEKIYFITISVGLDIGGGMIYERT